MALEIELETSRNHLESYPVPSPSVRPNAPASASRDSGAPGLSDRAWRLWRQIRIGYAFTQFAATCLAVAYLAAPIIRVRARDRAEVELAVQRLIRLGYAFSLASWKALGILRVDVSPLRRLEDEGACIIVANHPTLLDAALFGSVLDQMDCIVNAGWTAQTWYLYAAIDAAGYILNDGGNAAVETCAARLRSGRRLLLFPEGTRSPWGSLGKFHRGAAHMALASGAPIVAVTIDCRPRMLGSARRWFEVADGMSHFKVRIAGRLDPADYAADRNTAMAARRMTEDMRRIFLEEPNLADA